jgi:transglutaminase-like putative cysteine protease
MGHLHGQSAAPTQLQTQGAQSQTQSASAVDPADSFVGIARALGFAARHVTGYVLAEGGRFHSWAEVWEDGLGWIGFDPRYDLCPADGHVRIASGLDSAGSVPVRTFPVLNETPEATVDVSAG